MQLIELPPEPVAEFINDFFGDTPGLVAHLRAFPSRQFSAYALVPEGTPFDRALEFNRGGFFSMSQTQLWLSNRLDGLRRLHKKATFFNQDVWMTVDDCARFLPSPRAALFHHNNSPYFWLTGNDFSYDRIGNTLHAPRAFIRLPHSPPAPCKKVRSTLICQSMILHSVRSWMVFASII